MRFERLAQDGRARRGRLHFSHRDPHGVVDTPAFMPVGIQGTVKGIFPEDISIISSKPQCVHLYMQSILL